MKANKSIYLYDIHEWIIQEDKLTVDLCGDTFKYRGIFCIFNMLPNKYLFTEYIMKISFIYFDISAIYSD